MRWVLVIDPDPGPGKPGPSVLAYATGRVGPAIASSRGRKWSGHPATSCSQCCLRQPSEEFWSSLCEALVLLAECQHRFREGPLPQMADLLRVDFRLPSIRPGQLLDDVLDFHEVRALA